MDKNRQQIRCSRCEKLLAVGEAKDMTIKCPRCKAYNTVRTERPGMERHERHKE